MVRRLFTAFGNFFVGNVLAIKSVAGGKNETRNNDTTKIEHESCGVGPSRHVTGFAAGGAKKADDLVFPSAARQLDHVLGRGCDIKIIYRRRDQDAIRRFDRSA